MSRKPTVTEAMSGVLGAMILSVRADDETESSKYLTHAHQLIDNSGMPARVYEALSELAAEYLFYERWYERRHEAVS